MSIFSKTSSQSDPNQPVSPIAFIPKLIAGIITPLELSSHDHTYVSDELTWLFHAVDNFLQVHLSVQRQLAAEREAIRQRVNREERDLIQRLGSAAAFVNKEAKIAGELEQAKPQIWQQAIAGSPTVAVRIPPNAERNAEAHNKILGTSSDFFLDDWAGTISANLKLITLHLTALDHLLKQAAKMGPAGNTDVALQHQIKDRRKNILASTQEIADILQNIFGILVVSPGQLAEWLEEN